jgi:hypothetical protein
LNEKQIEALKAFIEAGGEKVEIRKGFFDKIREYI